MKIIPKFQTHIHDEIVSLFPNAVAEFKMLRLTMPQRKFVIEFMMKHIQVKIVDFNFTKLLMKLFYKTDKWWAILFVVMLGATSSTQRQQSEMGSQSFRKYVFDVRGSFLST